jgi:DNA-binding transcriptional ArsR family regulator
MVMHTTFETLGDPTRRRIVEVLASGETAVGEIVSKLDIRQSGVSRHLRILNDAGFVQMRPDGQRRLYSLRPEPFRDLDAWIETYRSLWDERLDRFADALARGEGPR